MKAKPEFRTRALAAACIVCGLAPVAGAKSTKAKAEKPTSESTASAAEKKMTLEGGEEGTSFPSLTIEGEDRIRIEFDRPELQLDLDPRSTQGLELGDTGEIVERERLDLVGPMLAVSAHERTPYLGRSWLDELARGPVARFRPELDGVERWKLTIADSRGQTVREFAGKGSPPEELEWDGVTADGGLALPGLTYSYALEAYDRAGNKRNFVGEGFEVGAYRFETRDALSMLFAGQSVQELATGRASEVPPPVVLEAASWINQAGGLQRPIRVEVTARTNELANALTQRIAAHLASLVMGDPVRIQPLARVEPDAPEHGTVAVTLAQK